MVLVRVQHQGLVREVEGSSGGEELLVRDLLSGLDTNGTARVFNVTGGHFVEPDDPIADIASDNDQLWVTSSERWSQCRSLGLLRGGDGRVSSRSVQCSHTRGDSKACSMCGMIRNMISIEVSGETSSRRRGSFGQLALDQALVTQAADTAVPAPPAKEEQARQAEGGGGGGSVATSRASMQAPASGQEKQEEEERGQGYSTPPRRASPLSVPGTASPGPPVRPRPAMVASSPLSLSTSRSRLSESTRRSRSRPPVPDLMVHFSDVQSEGPSPATSPMWRRHRARAPKTDPRHVDAFLQEHLLGFVMLYHRPMRKQHLRDSSSSACRVSEADLLLWSLFQHSAKRGALANHLREVNTEMSVAQLRALCYDLRILRGAFRPSESQTTSAGVPPLLVRELFDRGLSFVDLIGVSSQPAQVDAEDSAAVSLLRSYWMSSGIALDRFHPSLNFIEFIFTCVKIAVAVQHWCTRPQTTPLGASSTAGSSSRSRGRTMERSFGRGGRSSLSPMSRSASPSLSSLSPSGSARMRIGGLTEVVLSLHKNSERLESCFRHFLAWHLLPFASQQGKLVLLRHARLGLVEPAVDVSEATEEQARAAAGRGRDDEDHEPDTPPGGPLLSPPQASLDVNRRQLEAIFQHYSELQSTAAPRTLFVAGSANVAAAASSSALAATNLVPFTLPRCLGPAGRSSLVGQGGDARLESMALLQATALIEASQGISRTLSRSLSRLESRGDALLHGGGYERPFSPGQRLNLEQLHRFSMHFKLVPDIVTVEELAAIYRRAQDAEWKAWRRRQQGGGQWSWFDGDDEDLLAAVKAGEDIAAPPSPELITLSFDGFLHVLAGIAQAGYGMDGSMSRGRDAPLDYLLEHMDASKGKQHVRRFYQYKVTKPFVLRGVASPYYYHHNHTEQPRATSPPLAA